MTTREDGTAGGPVSTRVRDALLLVFKIAFTAGLLWLILSHVGIELVLQRISAISLGALAAVIGLMFVHMALCAFRWHVLLQCLGSDPPPLLTFRASMLERFVNNALPSTLGGDTARVIEMKVAGISLRATVLSVIFDRCLGIAGIMLMIAFTFPLFLARVHDVAIRSSLVAALAISAIGILAVILPPERFWIWTRSFALLSRPADLVIVTRALFRSPRFVVIGFGTSIATLIVAVLCYLILADSLRIPLTLTDLMTFVPVITLFSLFPLAIAGWGAREGATVVLFGALDVAGPDAVALSVIFGLMGLIAASVGGLVWLAMTLMAGRSRPRNASAHSSE